jgi:hypothetical protein
MCRYVRAWWQSWCRSVRAFGALTARPDRGVIGRMGRSKVWFGLARRHAHGAINSSAALGPQSLDGGLTFASGAGTGLHLQKQSNWSHRRVTRGRGMYSIASSAIAGGEATRFT